jgi:GH43 family beta-xylosidase
VFGWVLIWLFGNSNLKIKYKIINGEPTRNPTKHTPLTLAKQSANNRRTIGENPLKGCVWLGSHLVVFVFNLKIKYKIINGEPIKNPTKHTPLTM